MVTLHERAQQVIAASLGVRRHVESCFKFQGSKQHPAGRRSAQIRYILEISQLAVRPSGMGRDPASHILLRLVGKPALSRDLTRIGSVHGRQARPSIRHCAAFS